MTGGSAFSQAHSPPQQACSPEPDSWVFWFFLVSISAVTTPALSAPRQLHREKTCTIYGRDKRARTRIRARKKKNPTGKSEDSRDRALREHEK